MNLLEFKRKLMTVPAEASPEMRAARVQDKDFKQAAAESDAFEALLKDALDVKPPEGLAEQIIQNQSMQPKGNRWTRPGFFAVAAAVMLAVALTSFNLVQQEAPANYSDHLAWHWDKHGDERMAMAMRVAQADPNDAKAVFASLGLEVTDELIGSMRLVKYCHDLQGEGAHIVLNSVQGPITLYYMPRAQAANQTEIQLPDGMLAHAVNVERGSLALIAAPEVNAETLVDNIQDELSFPPGISL